MKIRFTLVALIPTILIIGCSKSKVSENNVVVARVEKSVLTAEDIDQHVGAGAGKEQKRTYVRRWLDRELLYQAAIKDNMHRTEEFRDKIEESERNLLSMAYLSDKISTVPQEISHNEIVDFYNANRDQYLRDEDVIRFAVFSLKTVKGAWNIRASLTAENFIATSKRFSTGKTRSKSKIPFVKKTELPKKLQESLFSIKEGGITTPIRVGDDVNLYLILEKGKKGEKATFDEVYSKVKNLLRTSQYQSQVDNVVNELRASVNYTVNSDYFDSTPENNVSLRGNKNE